MGGMYEHALQGGGPSSLDAMSVPFARYSEMAVSPTQNDSETMHVPALNVAERSIVMGQSA